MKVKIFVVDSYQGVPLREFDNFISPLTNKRLTKVPVIRVFGISSGGQKCCIHVHNAFPYLLVPCPNDEESYRMNFGLCLDRLLNDSNNANNAFVYDIVVATAKSMYGYSEKEETFFKIQMLNPLSVKRAAEVLLSGKVMGQRFQPFEAHIPCHLQFLIQFNLYGCDWMIVKKAVFREGSWCNDVVSCQDFLLGQSQRRSCCAVECDIQATEIENQFHPFGEASVSSLSALWEDERNRRLGRGMKVDELKLQQTPEDRHVPVNPREQTLLKRFAEIKDIAKSVISDRHYQLANTSEVAFTQLLEDIIGDAEIEKQSVKNDWSPVNQGPPSYSHASEMSMTQVLEKIVGGAAVENFHSDPIEEFEEILEDDIEPGSILSSTQQIESDQAADEMNESTAIEDVDVEEDLKDIDWNAFVNDDEELSLSQQLDGTNDRSKSKRSASYKEQESKSPLRKRRSIQTADEEEASPSHRPSRSQFAPSPIIPIPSSSSSSSSVIIYGIDSPITKTPDIHREPSSRGAQKPVDSDVEVDTSSIYSFHSSNLFLPQSVSDSYLTLSPSVGSDTSVKFTGTTPSPGFCRVETTTPRFMDQTSIQFFHDDLTPFPANESEMHFENRGTLKPKRKPPSRSLVERWLSLPKKSPLLSDTTVAFASEDADQSCIAPSQKLPALTSTPHPQRLLNKTSTSTMMLADTTISSPTRSHTPFSFAVKSMKNVSQVGDSQHKFAAEHLTVISMELHALSNSIADASRDPIACVIFSKMTCKDASFNNEIETTVLISKEVVRNIGSSLHLPTCTAHGPIDIRVFDDEYALIACFLDELEHIDPDIICGYDIDRGSVGYLVRRATSLHVVDIIARLGRILPVSITAAPANVSDSKDLSISSVRGRVIFAIWRLLRHELEHIQSYSFESAAFHVLHRRMPKFDNGLLSWWLRQSSTKNRTILYYIERSVANIQILTRLNLLSRTSELARLYGILFYDCLSRGSQYRVEAVMLRLVKRLSFVAISPSMQQRSSQCAPECIALTLEPISNYYKSPVIVLDFQSLYPSIMIAYNYSFDTCLGRLERIAKGGPQQLGCISEYEVPNSVLAKLSVENDINISPNGIVFVKRHVRRGVLPAIVEDLLNSRLMVKASMKLYKDDPAVTKLLDARQLGLKLLANVTYGYTAANFSGRMPCIEVADAIVRKGRECLENAIALVTSRRNEWGGARVIYGDTDSLFVLVPGATMAEAFDIGAKIADAVTNANPAPIKLKLEKVFSRCILEAKKRYCGFMYESVDQKEPEFLSKGLETMRKDQCPYVAKLLERSIRVLFSTDSNEQVVRFLKKEIRRLETGGVPIPELLLSREYRGAETYSEKGSAAAFLLANRRKAANPLSEPLAVDRVHYMITVDAPGTGIMQSAREPIEVVSNALRPNVDYYIRRQLLPALDRALGTAGIDVFKLITGGIHTTAPSTIAENNRIRMPTYSKIVAAASSKVVTLTQMYTRRQCVICGTLTTSQAGFTAQVLKRRASRIGFRGYGNFDKLCVSCRSQPSTTVALLSSRAATLERKVEGFVKNCQACCRFQPILNTNDLNAAGLSSDKTEFFACSSTDCPIFYEQYNRESLMSAASECRDILKNFESRCVVIDDN